MNRHLVFIFAAIILPFTAADYGHSRYSGSHDHVQSGSYLQSRGSNGVEEVINAASGSQQAAASLTATADVGAAHAAQIGLARANAQLQELNTNSNFQNLKNSDSIAESLAEHNLAANIRHGNIHVVAPNVVSQTALRSLLIPNGLNNHQVIATQPLLPIVVNQPGSPPAQISSGPPAVVRAAPVVYKLKPSIIYQQEVVNKVPTPLSLNPVYVKVYKSGKLVDAPIRAPSFAPASFASSSFDGLPPGGPANEADYSSPQYDSASQFAVPPSAGYGSQPFY